MQTYEVTVDENGTIRWHQNGLLHRLDGPAIEWADGDKFWYQNGVLHRTDGPAIEHISGDKYWYQKSELHRLDGPAIEWADGTKVWCQNGLRHRLDGPAVEWVNGIVEYWIENEKLSKDEFLTRTQVKELTVAEIEQLLGHPVKIVK